MSAPLFLFLLHPATLPPPRRHHHPRHALTQHIYEDRHNSGPVKLFLHYGDLTDSTNLVHIISEVKPDEIYNLGAMSHVKVTNYLRGRYAPNYNANTWDLCILDD